MTIETHPLEPFLPENARILFLGSFPPPKARWSMEFFYPNWINDFWRIQGLIHFGDKQYFEEKPTQPPLPEKSEKARRFDRDKIVMFCNEKGLAFYDTARKVCRLKNNADDNFLEIVEGTDVLALLHQMPLCRTIVTTGGKASEELQAYFARQGIEVAVPRVGEKVCLSTPSTFNLQPSPSTSSGTTLTWWRMPSTSRAYPMKLERKAENYKKVFDNL